MCAYVSLSDSKGKYAQSNKKKGTRGKVDVVSYYIFELVGRWVNAAMLMHLRCMWQGYIVVTNTL